MALVRTEPVAVTHEVRIYHRDDAAWDDAHRRAGHRLPGAELQPDGRWRLDLPRLMRRCTG